MKKKNWKLFAILCAAAAVIMLVFDWRMTLSFLLGAGVSVGTYFLTERYCDIAISTGSPAGSLGQFAANYMLWTAALVACALLPQYLNILTCALGLVMIKISLVAGENKFIAKLL